MTTTVKKKPAARSRKSEARQLADLAALLGLMQSASRISQELDALANEVGGSLEKLTDRLGVPFFDVHSAYARAIGGVTRHARGRRKAKKNPRS